MLCVCSIGDYNRGMNTEIEETTPVLSPTLKATDRCDAGCGAAAKVLVKGLEGELYFCGHHYAKHESALGSWAFETVDERWTLYYKPGASA